MPRFSIAPCIKFGYLMTLMNTPSAWAPSSLYASESQCHASYLSSRALDSHLERPPIRNAPLQSSSCRRVGCSIGTLLGVAQHSCASEGVYLFSTRNAPSTPENQSSVHQLDQVPWPCPLRSQRPCAQDDDDPIHLLQSQRVLPCYRSSVTLLAVSLLHTCCP